MNHGKGVLAYLALACGLAWLVWEVPIRLALQGAMTLLAFLIIWLLGLGRPGWLSVPSCSAWAEVRIPATISRYPHAEQGARCGDGGDQMSVLQEILTVFDQRGSAAYFGENVSVTEHSLQAANAARLEGAPAPLILAALLHDVGHLIESVPDDIADWMVDARHEEVGSRWLALRFGPEVYEPVRLHVPAKRYLCAVDSSYFTRLSPASARTLELQGGQMSADEVVAFERERFFAEAVRVRRWDDQGKVARLAIPPLVSYRDIIEASAVPVRPACAS
jgi:phosphonate degradation associated HDIG domain protein